MHRVVYPDEPVSAMAAEEEMLFRPHDPRVIWSPQMHFGCMVF